MDSTMLTAIVTAIIVTILTVALLKYKEIISWFLGNRRLKEEDEARVAFTVKEELENGRYKVVQGIFDKKTDKIIKGVEYNAEELDEDLSYHHKKDKLVIYQ